ncbi:MAG: hypothetical protein ACRCZ0_12010 [Cetobacterium sp.]
MRVYCTSNIDAEHLLTVGKMYSVIREIGNCWVITTDECSEVAIGKWRFE